MAKKRFNIETVDKNTFYIETPGFFYLACCDCGLRHLAVIEEHRKGIKIGMSRDDYHTDMVRKFKKKIRIVKR